MVREANAQFLRTAWLVTEEGACGSGKNVVLMCLLVFHTFFILYFPNFYLNFGCVEFPISKRCQTLFCCHHPCCDVTAHLLDQSLSAALTATPESTCAQIYLKELISKAGGEQWK